MRSADGRGARRCRLWGQTPSTTHVSRVLSFRASGVARRAVARVPTKGSRQEVPPALPSPRPHPPRKVGRSWARGPRRAVGTWISGFPTSKCTTWPRFAKGDIFVSLMSLLARTPAKAGLFGVGDLKMRLLIAGMPVAGGGSDLGSSLSLRGWMGLSRGLSRQPICCAARHAH